MEIYKNFWRKLLKLTRSKLGVDLRPLAIVGVIVSIAAAIFAPVDLWARFTFGYVAIIIIAVCFILAAWDLWREIRDDALPLAKLRDDQRQNLRGYINAVLSEVKANRKGKSLFLFVEGGILSQLLFELDLIGKIKGYVFIPNCDPECSFNFENSPRKIHFMGVSSAVIPLRQEFEVSGLFREKLEQEWKRGKPPQIRLKLEIYPKEYDPILIDPSGDDIFRLCMPLGRP
jgi:hypothetical protein